MNKQEILESLSSTIELLDNIHDEAIKTNNLPLISRCIRGIEDLKLIYNLIK